MSERVAVELRGAGAGPEITDAHSTGSSVCGEAAIGRAAEVESRGSGKVNLSELVWSAYLVAGVLFCAYGLIRLAST